MNILKSARVRLLLVANAIAFAFMFASAASVRADGEGWETFCPPTVEGCDCGPEIPFSPAGCYDNGGDIILCSSNAYCTNPE